MSPAEAKEIQDRMDQYAKELKAVYEEYVDGVTADYKRITVELIFKFGSIAFLIGILGGMGIATLIEVIFS